MRNGKLLLAVALFVLTGSCTEHFEELNTDPNYPTDTPAINLFTQVQKHSISTELGFFKAACWSQQWCGAQYATWDWYMDMSYDFQNSYITDLLDLEIIIRQVKDNIQEGSGKDIQRDNGLLAAAKIMRVWIFHLLTDILGDIPYSESFQGLEMNGIMTPKYDSQESIYSDLLQELDEANNLLNLSDVINFGTQEDLLFGGDPYKWRKFGNALRLRILNRCAGTPWAYAYDMAGTGVFISDPGPAAYSSADLEMGNVLNNPDTYPIISGSDDNAKLSYLNIRYKQPIYDLLHTRLDFIISETMVNWLRARNDPRLQVFAQVTQKYAGGQSSEPYVGEQNGLYQIAADFPSVSLLGKQIGYDESVPVYVLTHDEVEFIKAEYYMRQGDELAARTAYEAGIFASMARWGVASGDYLSGPEVSWDNAATEGEKYQLILEQKWAGMFGQGWQAWHEVRRTGFPARIFEYELEATLYPGLGLPVRLRYPDSEANENAENLAAAKATQNIEVSNQGLFSTDGIKSQMWWHTRKNPIPTNTDPPEK